MERKKSNFKLNQLIQWANDISKASKSISLCHMIYLKGEQVFMSLCHFRIQLREISNKFEKGSEQK